MISKLYLFGCLFTLSMDTNGVITINSKEWSRQPIVEKTENIPEIILYWKHSTVSSTVCTEKKKTCSSRFLRKIFQQSYLGQGTLYFCHYD